MKTTINRVWAFINSKVFTYVLIIIAILLWANSCKKNGELERQSIVDKQNLSALTDTIRTVKMKSGELNLSISGFISNEKDLKNLNLNLYKKVKEQDGKIITLGTANIKLKQDKAILQKALDLSKTRIDSVITINDSTFIMPWKLVYTYDSLNSDIFTGRTEVGVRANFSLVHNNTWIDERETKIDLTFGQKIENGNLRVFVQSGYPGFSAESLNGVLIDPNTNPYFKSLMKPRRWFTGLTIGIGATMGYDIFTSTPGLVVGPTINYGIYSFKK